MSSKKRTFYYIISSRNAQMYFNNAPSALGRKWKKKISRSCLPSACSNFPWIVKTEAKYSLFTNYIKGSFGKTKKLQNLSLVMVFSVPLWSVGPITPFSKPTSMSTLYRHWKHTKPRVEGTCRCPASFHSTFCHFCYLSVCQSCITIQLPSYLV